MRISDWSSDVCSSDLRGELDLVMLDGDTVVFVEVRYRKNTQWGGALDSIDARKRQKLIFAAQYFLQIESRWADYPCRFDVVAIDSNEIGRASCRERGCQYV